jgi:cytochrome c peroxidase
MKVLVVVALVACKGGAPAEQGSGSSAPKGPSQGVLPRLPALALPDDPKREQKIELGHVLFFDPRLSANGDRSCYSCHRNEDGTGGHDPIAPGGTRHAPVLWNVGYYDGAFYWDGRAKSLDGVGAEKLDPAPLLAIPAYKQLFDAAYPGVPIKADQMAEALSEYERTLICNDTAYDRFAGGDKAAMTEQQQRGLDLFVDKAGCITCHSPPHFTTAQARPGGVYFKVGVGNDDPGRMNATHDAADRGKFKPPTLRNITRSAPYFHDGSVARLEDAIKHGGDRPRTLSDAERADLLAFLSALDCPNRIEEAKVP